MTSRPATPAASRRRKPRSKACPMRSITADRQVWRDGHLGEGTRLIPEETAIALTYNGGTYAVMMGTPQNLQDFAIGFSLSEGIVQSPDEIDSLDIVELDDGIELRMWLASSQRRARQRATAAYRGPHRLRHLRRSSRSPRPCARPRSWPRGACSRRHEIMAAMASIDSVAADQHRDPRGACGGVLDAGARHRGAARGCRPPQRARQARRRAGAGSAFPPARAWCC